MLNQILLYAGSAFIAFWGIVHLFPTRSVVSGFGEISADNKRIITMEWIIEGIALIFIGFINAVVTAVDHASSISLLIYLSSVVVLLEGFFSRVRIQVGNQKISELMVIIISIQNIAT